MGQGSHDMVDLVDVLLEANVKRLTTGERLPIEPGLSRRTLSEMLLAQATDFRPRRRPHYAEHHFVGMVVAGYEALDGGAVHVGNRIHRSEDVAGHGMTFEQFLLKFVKYGIRWAVEKSIQFIQNDIALLLDFIDWKRGVERDIRNQFHRSLQMLFGKGSVNPRVFFGCVGIELTANRIQSIQHMKRLALCGALEQSVLNEVGNPRFSRTVHLIPGARIDNEAAVRDWSTHMLVDDPEPIFKLRRMEFFFAPVGQGAIEHFGHLRYQNGRSSSSSADAAIGGTSGSGAEDTLGA